MDQQIAALKELTKAVNCLRGSISELGKKVEQASKRFEKLEKAQMEFYDQKNLSEVEQCIEKIHREDMIANLKNALICTSYENKGGNCK